MKQYNSVISSTINRKGVLDIDSVKGCSIGMSKYPRGGCYGLCYAAKIAKLYNYDFTKSISRKIIYRNPKQLSLFSGIQYGGVKSVLNMVKKHNLKWFRIGTMGDPSHDWATTLKLCEWLCMLKTPVVVTKHWLSIPEEYLKRFKKTGVVFNTSVSPLDTDSEIIHRLGQFERLKIAGIRSVLRIVSCKFGDTKIGKQFNKKQKELFKTTPNIDNPLRIPQADKRVLSGDIITKQTKDLNCIAWISRANSWAYIGKCQTCPDQCGVL